MNQHASVPPASLLSMLQFFQSPVRDLTFAMPIPDENYTPLCIEPKKVFKSHKPSSPPLQSSTNTRLASCSKVTGPRNMEQALSYRKRSQRSDPNRRRIRKHATRPQPKQAKTVKMTVDELKALSRQIDLGKLSAPKNTNIHTSISHHHDTSSLIQLCSPDGETTHASDLPPSSIPYSAADILYMSRYLRANLSMAKYNMMAKLSQSTDSEDMQVYERLRTCIVPSVLDTVMDALISPLLESKSLSDDLSQHSSSHPSSPCTTPSPTAVSAPLLHQDIFMSPLFEYDDLDKGDPFSLYTAPVATTDANQDSTAVDYGGPLPLSENAFSRSDLPMDHHKYGAWIMDEPSIDHS
ncbi:uncharacterized protein BYT42DRAFT_554343 [Radiomyces spectabilis]|uniref:uncharacterized protein n=1 Tax=Radiomyces spectabilis TaxID=64574 RepID=UPI00221E4716|nr:uncharacterized protein BYT42DRAFT_554343 [Radiomyces spectabilis]KAI8394355.1 hypothetical protein BYT42DRAFT_554343 [Radiomyces spectabilis]